MKTNLNLSQSDNLILKLIIDDLLTGNTPIISKNIRRHPLFSKIDQKSAFDNDEYLIIPVGLSMMQKEKKSFNIEISGTGIDLNNSVHKQFVQSIISEATERLIILVKTVERLGIPDLDNNPSYLEEKLKDILSASWNKN